VPVSALSVIKSDSPEKWQVILSDLITDPKELLQILELEPPAETLSKSILKQFPLKAPRPYVARIEKGNWQDPLLKQLWPEHLEDQSSPDYSLDPLAELSSNPVPGLLHKYAGRVLLTPVSHCAIHCRYCFRRHFDYQQNTPSKAGWTDALDYIRQDQSIEEVIYSGGDPLAAADRHLAWLTEQIEQISHVKTLRIHTRLPILIPQRVNQALINWLTRSRLKVVMVLHVNHPRELDPAVAHAINTLSTNGITMLNQSVLLKDVNDNSSVLAELSKALFSINVLPYYLHTLDKIQGVAHFDIPEPRALEIIEELRKMLPGYLVPRLVRELPGQESKMALT
jgi:EF-P beta-lysylation protein EpmB